MSYPKKVPAALWHSLSGEIQSEYQAKLARERLELWASDLDWQERWPWYRAAIAWLDDLIEPRQGSLL